MTSTPPLGQLLHSFFVDHLITVKGLRPASVRSYRDTIRLLLVFAAADKGCKITRLKTSDLTFERVVGFLRHLEEDRGNHTRTRNQRLAAVHTLFDYIATRDPEMLGTCQRVTAIPMNARPQPRPSSSNATRSKTCYITYPERAGSRCEIEPCCCSSTTPGRGCKKWPTCGSNTSTSASTHWCACTARATSGAPAHCGSRPRNSCAPYWTRRRHRGRRRHRYSAPRGGP